MRIKNVLQVVKKNRLLISFVLLIKFDRHKPEIPPGKSYCEIHELLINETFTTEFRVLAIRYAPIFELFFEMKNSEVISSIPARRNHSFFI